MRRTFLALVAASFLFVGCGKTRPVAFSSTARPIAEKAQGAVRGKKAEELEKIVKVATGYHSNGKLMDQELNVLTKSLEYAKSGNWDAADKLLTGSLNIK